MAFLRPQHNLIADVLRSMDKDFLCRSKCYFGGGTAIVLQNGEYRLSLDIDFLCADVAGYRELRTAITRHGTQAIFGPEVETIRGFKVDQYGIRGIVGLQDQAVKFEIVREARISLDGMLDAALGVPILSVESLFAEKLLANADRCLDRSVACRDAIDLGFLIKATGYIPAASIERAEIAYGSDVVRFMKTALERLASPKEAEMAAVALQMTPSAVDDATRALHSAAIAAWPNAEFPPLPDAGDGPGP